jgi:hypothetical protein
VAMQRAVEPLRQALDSPMESEDQR